MFKTKSKGMLRRPRQRPPAPALHASPAAGRTTPQRFADSRRSSGGRRLPQGEPQDRDRALKTSPGCRSSALWDATPVERSQMFRTQDAPADG